MNPISVNLDREHRRIPVGVDTCQGVLIVVLKPEEALDLITSLDAALQSLWSLPEPITPQTRLKIYKDKKNDPT